MVIKFNPQGDVLMGSAASRKPSDKETGPLEHRIRHCRPMKAASARLTDTGLGPGRQRVYQRRLHQFTRREGGQERELAQIVGNQGQQAGRIPPRAQHRRDAQGNIYVADRGKPPDPGFRTVMAICCA